MTLFRTSKPVALVASALCAGLIGLATPQPASAGASTGTWKYYPGGAPYAGRGYYGGGYGPQAYYGGYGRGYYGQPAYGYGRGYGYGGYPYYYRERRNNAGAAVAAGAIGLAAGAILGNALSQRSAVDCTRYRSYNPRTGTFVGRNGVRYACR